MKKINKVKKYKKYIVMSKDGLSMAGPEYFDSLDSWTKALSVGVSCYAEIQRVLIEDGIDGDDSYVGNMKVTTGLQRSLDEINDRYPSLIDHIHSTSLLVNGTRVFRC